jgi:hypothetical protein
MFPNPPEKAKSYYTYQLDSKGRPINMTSRHVVNDIDWRGFYRYTNDEVEYVEFCLQREAVSEYARIALQAGVPITFQRIDINGGAAHLGGRAGKDAIDYISKDSYHYWIQIEDYDLSDGRIVSGKALAEGSGLSPVRSALEYSYSDAGRLERIVCVLEDGRRTTQFAARSKSGMRELAARLSERIATQTIEALRKVDFGAPLLAVELSFRSVENYLPLIIPATENDSIPNLVLPTTIDKRKWITLDAEAFEPEMADFTDRLSTAEQWGLGSRMLRQAALIITKLASGSLITSDFFVAFAIDWEFEGHDLPAILKECGASAAALKKLKSMGWLE